MNRFKKKVVGKSATVARRVARQACSLEPLESRRMMSVSWTIDSDRTLQVTTDDNHNSVGLSSYVGEPGKLRISDNTVALGANEYIPLTDFDRINVQMGNGPFNYAGWGDVVGSLSSKPANFDLGAGGAANNAMFFYASGTASLSGDGRTGAQFSADVGTAHASTVTFKNATVTQLGGGDEANYFDASAFTSGLGLGGGVGSDTLIGGNGEIDYLGTIRTQYWGGDGDDVIQTTGGLNEAFAGPGNDTYIGGTGTGGMYGEEGDDTFIHGTGREFFIGGPGNDTVSAVATGGPDTIALGQIDGDQTYVFFGNNWETSFRMSAENLSIDAGAGVDDGIIPATPGSPYPDKPIAGLDPNLTLRITHLEPTVNAGADADLLGSHAFAATGSFRDIGDPSNAWTATVDYGDGTGAHPLSINPGTISTSKGPARTFNLGHDYLAAGTYTVTVTVTDSEGNLGTDTLSVSVADMNIAPVANADTYATAQDTPLVVSAAVGVLANDTDPDGDALSAVLLSAPAHGTFAFAGDGSFTYVPDEGFLGTDSFTYRARDGRGGESSATVSLTVTAAAPGAVLVPDPCGDGGDAVLVHGTAGNDSILINPVGSTGSYAVTLNGSSLGTFSAPRVLIVAGAGDDSVQVAGSVTASAWLFGDAGNDRLYAGGNASVVAGGDGNDELLGGSGRDLLIGGRGADRLVGNAGDDILIAGYTNHDDNLVSLCKIMDEWTRTDADFATRINHLDGPINNSGGLNARVFLNARTVQDDGDIDQIDVLTGSAGDDWYLYAAGSGDRATGVSKLEAGEAITNI
jgi:hypothetical protein